MIVYYLLTISSQQKKLQISKKDLQDIILWLKMNIPSLNFIEERYEVSGKYTQLHFHGIVSVSSRFQYRAFAQWGDLEHTNKTYRVHWSKMYNYNGALKYIDKDVPSFQKTLRELFYGALIDEGDEA